MSIGESFGKIFGVHNVSIQGFSRVGIELQKGRLVIQADGFIEFACRLNNKMKMRFPEFFATGMIRK